MHARTAAARALTRQAVERSTTASKSDISMILEAVVAKDQAVQCAEHVVHEAVQIFGGMGYMRESEVERHYRETTSEFMRADLERYLSEVPCPTCGGRRLRPEVLAVTIGGRSIVDVSRQSVGDALEWAASLDREGSPLGARERKIGRQVLKEIRTRLDFLADVGLDYLTLDRSAATLAGGEAQRIRLATQIGSGLTGVLYILDEPSIGLHARDNMRLLRTLLRLRDLGNTVLVVEHDRDTMLAADWIVDLGPEGGDAGGEIVAEGTPEQVAQSGASYTGKFLRELLPRLNGREGRGRGSHGNSRPSH
jgi:excinuclease ABC subunit A